MRSLSGKPHLGWQEGKVGVMARTHIFEKNTSILLWSLPPPFPLHCSTAMFEQYIWMLCSILASIKARSTYKRMRRQQAWAIILGSIKSLFHVTKKYCKDQMQPALKNSNSFKQNPASLPALHLCGGCYCMLLFSQGTSQLSTPLHHGVFLCHKWGCWCYRDLGGRGLSCLLSMSCSLPCIFLRPRKNTCPGHQSTFPQCVILFFDILAFIFRHFEPSVLP